MATDWFQFPVISALMISANPERHDLALLALEDFLAQDWVHKELVIVNTTDLGFPKHKGVYEINMRRVTDDLWTFGIGQCNGEWVADWQDDSRYDATYLRVLARRRRKDATVRLQTYMGRMIDTGESVLVDNLELKYGLVFRFLPKTLEVVWLDRPELVTRFYAGKHSQV